MRITLDKNDLQPLIESVVAQTMNRIEADHAKTAGRIGLTEAEAAAAMGVQRHVLRDARLRGEIKARKVGKKIVYSREELIRFLGGRA